MGTRCDECWGDPERELQPKEVPECFINFNLMVSTNCEPTSASRIRRLVNLSGVPHVEHLDRCGHDERLRATSQLATDRCSSHRWAAGFWRPVLCASGLFIVRMKARGTGAPVVLKRQSDCDFRHSQAVGVTMREEFVSYSFLAVTVAGLVVLCSGLLTIAFS
jgi:hypothetical protein